MHYLIAEMHRIERQACGVQEDETKARPVATPLVLGTCPDYQDAVDTLLDLRDGPLSLGTQSTCRRLRVLVNRLAVEVARELLEGACGS